MQRAQYTEIVSLSEAEFFEAGMSLPPDVREHVALRLLGLRSVNARFSRD